MSHMTEAVQAMEKVLAVSGSIVVVGELTHALHYTLHDLKAAHMNAQCSLIWVLMLYKFVQGNNIYEATKNIWCMKDEGAVDQSTVINDSRNFD